MNKFSFFFLLIQTTNASCFETFFCPLMKTSKYLTLEVIAEMNDRTQKIFLNIASPIIFSEVDTTNFCILYFLLVSFSLVAAEGFHIISVCLPIFMCISNIDASLVVVNSKNIYHQVLQ